MKNFLAIDIGATSGRAVLGTISNNSFKMDEIHRFDNNIIEVLGKYYWNVFQLYEEIITALKICSRKGIELTSIGIDTWGVDFGYIGKDGSLLSLPRAYRDPYTNGEPERYFQKVSQPEVYTLTGIQVMNFNSLYQLSSAKNENFAPINSMDKVLFMPDLLSYMLTGKMVCEKSIASTSQIYNPTTEQMEGRLLNALNISPDIFAPLVSSGTVIGNISNSIAVSTNVGSVPVVAVAGHDTASAVAAVPAENEHFAYLSSGTWSLMGIETQEPIINETSLKHNFTNEAGIEGTTRFLKNITGMWLLEQCRKEWVSEGKSYTYAEIVEMANSVEPLRSFVNPDNPMFANPQSMTKAIADFCKNSGQEIPNSHAQFIRLIFDSLAMRYRDILTILEQIAPFKIDKLHIIGGGSKNKLLNQLTANIIGKTVVAGPAEATAIGNCMIQAKSAGLLSDRWEMRKAIKSFVQTDVFHPQNDSKWEQAYERYKTVTNN